MSSYERIKPGDKIRARGYTFTVDRILWQDYNGDRDQTSGDCWGYDIEFLDPLGAYHHWKQNQDHGEVIRARRGA